MGAVHVAWSPHCDGICLLPGRRGREERGEGQMGRGRRCRLHPYHMVQPYSQLAEWQTRRPAGAECGSQGAALRGRGRWSCGPRDLLTAASLALTPQSLISLAPHSLGRTSIYYWVCCVLWVEQEEAAASADTHTHTHTHSHIHPHVVSLYTTRQIQMEMCWPPLLLITET